MGPISVICAWYVTLHFYLLNKAAIQVAVVQLVEATRYIPGDRGFDLKWCHGGFQLT